MRGVHEGRPRGYVRGSDSQWGGGVRGRWGLSLSWYGSGLAESDCVHLCGGQMCDVGMGVWLEQGWPELCHAITVFRR